MLIALGMYLPFDTVAAIFVGGVFEMGRGSRQARYSVDEKLRAEEKAP